MIKPLLAISHRKIKKRRIHIFIHHQRYQQIYDSSVLAVLFFLCAFFN